VIDGATTDCGTPPENSIVRNGASSHKRENP
jgi:hypothetical protein